MKIKTPKAGNGWMLTSTNLPSIPVPHMAYQHPSGITVISDIVQT